MNTSFLIFRCRQLARFFQRTGFGFILLILFLLSGSILQGISNMLLLPDVFIAGGFALLLLIMFTQRTDYEFLVSTDQFLFFVYSIDAVLLALLVSLPLLIFGKFLVVIAIIGLCLVISFLWPLVAPFVYGLKRSKGGLRLDFPFLRSSDFEFRAMLRSNGYGLGVFYCIALSFIWHPASLFVLAFIVLALLQSTLEYYEPKEMIFHYPSPAQLLWSKSIRLSVLIHLLFLPFYVIGLILSFSYWYLYALIFVATSVMVFFSIFNKYVFYRPGLAKGNTSVIAGIMLLFLLLPGFQLIVLFMSVVQYIKAKRNLKLYW